MNAVAAGGEVVPLDSAGYGPVSIEKSVTIVAPDGIYAGITVDGGAGVVLNGDSVSVTLRGLAINATNTPNVVEFTAGSTLVLERCRVQGGTNAQLNILSPSSETAVKDCTFSAGSSGVMVQSPTSSAVLDRTLIEGETAAGVHVTNGTATIRECLVTGCNQGVVATSANSKAFVNASLVTNNVIGIAAYANGTIFVADTEISGSASRAIWLNGGVVFSRNPASNTLLNNISTDSFSDYYWPM